ncbi:MAG: hypothetical protein AB1Z98_36450 [Nannocystaceae bacterium]
MARRALLAAIALAAVGGCFEDSTPGTEPSGTMTASSTTTPCDQGSVGCSCFPNGTCDPGLVCGGGQCEPFDDSTSSSTSSDGTTSMTTAGVTDSTSTGADSDSGETGSTTGSAPAHILFVTSTQYDGLALGGLAGADTICTDIGQRLRPGPWVAVLRDEVTSFASRITVGGDVVNTNGDLLATDESELLSGTVQNRPAFDEDGAGIGDQDLVWTGSTVDACVGWSSSEPTDLGAVGLPTDPERWLDTEVPLPCSGSPRLYCISQ